MTSGKHHIALFGNGYRENIIFSLNAGESVICYFKDSGVDSASAKYFDLKHAAKKVAITVSAVATITHINKQELKSPRTLGTDVVNTFKEGIEWSKITVRADVDSTSFEIYAS